MMVRSFNINMNFGEDNILSILRILNLFYFLEDAPEGVIFLQESHSHPSF